jgi:hypothetical protein
MPRHMFLLFILALALLIAAIGCRNSAKSAPSAPAGSPTPSKQAQTAVPTPGVPKPAPHTGSRPDLTTLVPVKIFQVKPPASFSGDELPEGPIEFTLAGSAGELLLMKTKEIPGADYYRGGGNAYSVLVRRSNPGSPAIKAIQEGGTCTYNSLYAFPEAGTYRVLFAPLPGEKHSIDLAVLPSSDPLMDPSIKPEEVSIDFGGLAQREKLEVVPLSMAEGCLDDSWPSHLAVVNQRFEFRIMSIAGYKKLFPSDSGMALLEAALRAGGKETKTQELPYSVNGDAALNLWTRPQFVEWSGWSGLRWIGSYSQDYSCGFGPDSLTYVFQGISNDGRFFILMRAQVSNLKVGRQLDQECAEKSRGQDFDAFSKKEMPALFDKEMSAADPASFQPNLDQLDAVIRSLKLR